MIELNETTPPSDDDPMREILETLLAEDEDITARAVARLHPIHQCGVVDPWSAKVDSADGHEHSIIHSSAENVATYLRNIDVLWGLGVKSKMYPAPAGAQH